MEKYLLNFRIETGVHVCVLICFQADRDDFIKIHPHHRSRYRGRHHHCLSVTTMTNARIAMVMQANDLQYPGLQHTLSLPAWSLACWFN